MTVLDNPVKLEIIDLFAKVNEIMNNNNLNDKTKIEDVKKLLNNLNKDLYELIIKNPLK